MKKLFFSLLTLVTAFLLISQSLVEALDDVEHFHSDITINQDASLSIVETIDYVTDLDKHGIYRYIPLTYQQESGNFSRNISNISVTDSNAQPISFDRYVESHNLVLKIGDPETTFTGQKTYRITYTVENALNRFPTHDELYWDITGEGWQIPIHQATATTSSNVATISESVCYSGPVGTNNSQCSISHTPSTATIFSNQVISYGDNLTVALKLVQPNAIKFPTASERFLKRLTDNWSVLLLPIPFIIMFFLWDIYGRDKLFVSPNVFNRDPNAPQQKKPLSDYFRTPFVYEPIQGLTPGEAGAILDEKVDNQDVIAEIIDLARKKYLKLEAKETKGLLSKSTEYTFTKLKSDDNNSLPNTQARLLRDIFKSADTVKLSSLKGKFYTTMEAVKALINDNLTKQGFFTTHPTRRRVIGVGLSILLHAIVIKTVATQLVIVDFFVSPFYPLVFGLFVILGLISLVLGFNLVQKSALGTNLSLQAKGLRRTIQYGKWREEIKEKNLFIEEILPFAISLGVIDKLAADMKSLNLKPPSYASAGFHSSSFNSMNMISSFSSTASSTLSYNPSSSSSSGGSGFSGGSSGGGGGGGGGGSW